MRPFDSAELFFYGTIRALRYMRAGRPFREYEDLVTDVAGDLTHFIGYHRHRMVLEVESLDELRNALGAADSLRGFIHGTLYPLRDAEIQQIHIDLLNERLNEFETALKIDLRALPIYVLEDKRGYSARQFIVYGKARAVLAKQNQQLLPKLALEDIDHAGKCLIHEQYTSAGFHTIRAIENICRIYYKAITGEAPINKKGESFPLGVLINALEGKCANLAAYGKDATRLTDDIIPVLKRIVKIYRNPIMHPEMILNEDDAIDVFDNAKTAIASILRDVNDGHHLTAWKAI